VGSVYESVLQPGLAEEVLAALPQNHWQERLLEYKRRKSAVAQAIAGPVVVGQKNWAPLGPAVVLNGQAVGLPAVGGRVPGIAIAPGGQIIYVASANGGVFHSDDGGMSWQSLMDAFDVQPTNLASTCLACGAIAIDPKDPNRIYVGTGEGDTNALFSSRIVNALPAYRGVGPIRSDDSGSNWIVEPTAAGSPDLAGKAFFALAVDTGNRENVIGATSEGLYQRTAKTGGAAQQVEWVQRRPGIHPSVVAVSSAGVNYFFAADWGGVVVRSSDGANWVPLGVDFPSGNVGRIALGVQANNPNTVYALVSDLSGNLLGLFRLDGMGGSWKEVSNPPPVLPSSQGDYDLAIAVDPQDSNLVYLGGSYYDDKQYFSGSVWRCQIQNPSAGYTMVASSIGTRAHADVHVLIHSPGDPNSLWLGCDGGVFLNRAPRTSDNFAPRNNGLACLCPNFLAQHPTDPNIIFCGLQDNGTARTAGGSIWARVNGGDGGYCLINWADPLQVLVFADGSVYRSVTGGQDLDGWTSIDFPWSTMTEPIVGPPYNPSSPTDGEIAAIATGTNIFISMDFGATWPQQPTITLQSQAKLFACVFASASRFFCGTTAGEVFRCDKSAGSWKTKRIDNTPAGALGLTGLISDIAINWADASLSSIYVSFGGIGTYQHIWHFDGTRWEPRSGPAKGANLLDVEHNAVTVDRTSPANIYVGADIGVWHSADAGQTWHPLANGLPEAPVFDLQIHPTRRLLRATTHGRGLYEFAI
jgi:photosystem II stability/assembly factor-like uncharacterized protein